MNLRSLVPMRDRSDLARFETYPFGSLQREMDRLFEEFSHTLPMLATRSMAMTSIVPNIDVTETDKDIEITAELPGLERKDVDISVEDNVLVVRGEKRIEPEQDNATRGDTERDRAQGGTAQAGTTQSAKTKEKEHKSYHVSERAYGAFYRMLQLPPGIDPSTIKATMSKGVLRITIPKPARAQAKKIEVQEEEKAKKQAA